MTDDVKKIIRALREDHHGNKLFSEIALTFDKHDEATVTNSHGILYCKDADQYKTLNEFDVQHLLADIGEATNLLKDRKSKDMVLHSTQEEIFVEGRDKGTKEVFSSYLKMSRISPLKKHCGGRDI